MDEPILSEIEALLAEEHQLRASKSAVPVDLQRLQALEVQLDRYWDLLRQRRAKREFGDDLGQAKLRAADVVEKYEN